jgi:hypothetical protein
MALAASGASRNAQQVIGEPSGVEGKADDVPVTHTCDGGYDDPRPAPEPTQECC